MFRNNTRPPCVSLQALHAKGAKAKAGTGASKRAGALLPAQVRRGVGVQETCRTCKGHREPLLQWTVVRACTQWHVCPHACV